MTKPNITPEQALLLCRLIPQGNVVGVDAKGKIVYTETKLSAAMDLLGMHRMSTWDTETRKWSSALVVAMLRDWANALETLNAQI